ncbi:hypothetical protein XELAEV_18041957mg [Xenopus laevis]|uniref:Uncharacterized protein n=1 Tax=Xenopus laevis TaxID=8355 RepID=A0A974H5L6_XENLA|nr:hypothetical protein XELAEV_18041957mg [Xenopus laevis]
MPDWTLNPDAVDSLGTCEASLSYLNIGQHGSSMWFGTSLFICLTLHCCNIKTSCLYSSLCGIQKTLVSFTEDFVGASFAPGNSPPPVMDSAAGLTFANFCSCCGNVTLNFCCHSLRSCSTLERSPGLHLAAANFFTIHKVSLTSGVFIPLAVRTLSQSLWNCIHQSSFRCSCGFNTACIASCRTTVAHTHYKQYLPFSQSLKGILTVSYQLLQLLCLLLSVPKHPPPYVSFR